jgi:hypothetical protein
MTPLKGLASLVVAALASAMLAAASGPDDASSVASAPRLKAISSRVNRSGASLVIEATEPLAYVATRPDPLTLQLDFRNATIDPTLAKGIAASANGPIGAVSIGPADGDGTPITRVRVALTQAVAHHVRSSRNSVIVEFEKSSGAGSRGPGFDSRPPTPESRPSDAMAALER